MRYLYVAMWGYNSRVYAMRMLERSDIKDFTFFSLTDCLTGDTTQCHRQVYGWGPCAPTIACGTV